MEINIENNKQIKDVFIEFSDTQINNKQDEKIFSDMYLNSRYPTYNAFFDFRDFFQLFLKNRKAVMQAQSVALKQNLIFLMSKNKEYFNFNTIFTFFLSFVFCFLYFFIDWAK